MRGEAERGWAESESSKIASVDHTRNEPQSPLGSAVFADHSECCVDCLAEM